MPVLRYVLKISRKRKKYVKPILNCKLLTLKCDNTLLNPFYTINIFSEDNLPLNSPFFVNLCAYKLSVCTYLIPSNNLE